MAGSKSDGGHPGPSEEDAVNDKPYTVLVVSSSNAARSIIAEALINDMGQGRFRAYSAGSHPAGMIHPLALEQLALAGCSIEQLHSRNWSEFAWEHAPQMDFVITVCGRVAAEACPVWPGKPLAALWEISDPTATGGSAAAQRNAFAQAFREIRCRVRLLVNLPVAVLDRDTIHREVQAIGGIAS